MVTSTGAGTEPRTRVWPWIVTLVVGIALCVTGFGVFVGRTIAGLFNHQASYTPFVQSMQLDTGTYYVFEATSSFSGSTQPQVSPGDVTVTSLAVGSVPSFLPVGSETFTSSGTSYQSVVGFTVDAAGTYRIRVASPSGRQVSVFIAPSVTTSLRSGLGWLALSGAGVLVALLGLTLLIVQLVRRGRTRGPPPFVPRCASGHPVRQTDRFCPACGAPVYPVATAVRTP